MKGRANREMGAALWSILALIFVPLSLPDSSRKVHAGGYYGEQLLTAYSYGRLRRSEHEDIARGNTSRGTGWNCDECRESWNSSDLERTLEEDFIARINESLESVFQPFTGQLLVHAGANSGDVLLYWNGGRENPTVKCIPANRYRRFKVVSHLPVEEAAIALGNVTNISDAVQDLIHRIDQLRNLTNLTADQEKILRMVDESLSNEGSNIKESLIMKRADFVESFKRIAHDAVKDYLNDLNTNIQKLNITMNDKNMTVVIYHRQFAYPESFIVRYYKLLFNYNVRIVLWPTLDENEHCSSDRNCSTTTVSDISAASSVTFERQINSTFNGLNMRCNSSIHDFMDTQTEQIICKDLKFRFEACPKPDMSLPGFQTRTEKAYVVLFVFFGACSVMLGIVLLAVCYEDRVMKAEGKASRGDKMLNNNRERPLSGISMQSNEEG